MSEKEIGANGGEVLRRPDGKLCPGTAPINIPRGPRRRTLATVMARILAEPPTPGELDAVAKAMELPEDLTVLLECSEDRLEVFGRVLWFRAATGNWPATYEIFDRVDPKPKQIELSGPDGGPIKTSGVNVSASASPSDARAAYMALVNGVGGEW